MNLSRLMPIFGAARHWLVLVCVSGMLGWGFSASAGSSLSYLRPVRDPLEIPYSRTYQDLMQDFVEEADRAIRNQEWTEAARILEQAVLYDSGAAPAFLALGHVYQQLGRHEDALLIARALMSRPDVGAEAAKLQLACLNALGWREQARIAGEQYRPPVGSGRDPVMELDQRIALANAGQAREVMGLLAAEYGAKAHATGDIGFALRAGVLYMASGRPEDAETILRSATRNHRDVVAPLQALAILSAGRGQIPEAMDYLQAALQLEPDHPDTLNNLSVLYRMTGRDADADAMLEQALARNPAHLAALGQMIGIEVSRGALSNATGWVEKALGHDPDSAELHWRRAQLAIYMKQWASAQPSLRRALRLNPNIRECNFLLGMLAEADGDPRQALNHYRRELAIQPEHVPSLNNAAWLLATTSHDALRNPQQAVMYARQACQLTGERSLQELDTLCQALMAAGDHGEAGRIASAGLKLAMQQEDPRMAEAFRAYMAGP